jgi:hypothetical protein
MSCTILLVRLSKKEACFRSRGGLRNAQGRGGDSLGPGFLCFVSSCRSHYEGEFGIAECAWRV